MKRICLLLGLMVTLSACSSVSREMNAAMELRNALLSAQKCSFSGEVTADYGDSIQVFSMNCISDAAGKITFEITSPESIAGICGSISDSGGTLDVEDTALYFDLMAEGRLTPAAAPWIFLKTLRGGYLTAACREEEYIHITVDDSFADDALTLDIWLDKNNHPVRGDILHDGRRILSLDVENFVIS